MADFEKVFIAGTMQGATAGMEIRDQSYRERIAGILRKYNSDIECIDPHILMQNRIMELGMPLALGYQKLADNKVVDERNLDVEVLQLREKFRELTALAGRCDLCVAFLPGHVPSMGTAMEMYATHLGGGTVVSITDMRQNLAVLSTSDVILPDVEEFEYWLANAR